jgi:hypothetical protein
MHVHPPSEEIYSWPQFFIHLAVIVLGLLIAVGIEQTVERLHHGHVRKEIEAQIHQILEYNEKQIASGISDLLQYRQYLGELQHAVGSRRMGQAAVAPRPADPRTSFSLSLPSLAPYEAAQESSLVALLPAARIRIYNRLQVQRVRLEASYDGAIAAVSHAQAFRRRWDLSPDVIGAMDRDLTVDLALLTPAELAEYQALIGAVFQATDHLVSRYRIFNAQNETVLKGARDEADLVLAIEIAEGQQK